MERRRTTWGAAIELAIALSVVAVAVSTLLRTVGLSQPVIVLGVIVIGFATSWIRTGRIQHEHQGHHRAVTVPVRRIHSSMS